MSRELAIRPEAGAVADYKPKGILELAQSKAVIHQIMKAIMKGPSRENKLGVHYGTIPGTPKPTLFKAGSELILSTFRISVDLEVEDLSTDDCIRYRVKSIGRLPDGTVVGYGIGECSTDEEKYRWKKPACDEEWAAADPTMRREKWGKSDGKVYKTKQIRTVPADLANTVLKMAKKRSQIDLTLTATGASDVFDQDLEDLKDVIDITEYQKPSGKPEVQQPRPTQSQGGEQGESGSKINPDEPLKPGGVALIKRSMEAKNIPLADFCQYMGVAKLEEILSRDMNKAMDAIKKWEAAP